jgi:arylsulfatase A-like enzyme
MNAIWIFGDQHRAQALSCNGNRDVNTPEIDRLAAGGVNFEQAVCGFPLCCPFRGSLLTSLYPHECVPGHEYPLPPDTPTIAKVFSDNAYETAYFGKWHLDGFHERDGRAAMHIVPPERRGGFDTWIGYENNNLQWDCWVHGHKKNGDDVEHHKLAGYETDCLTDYLLEFIGERKKDDAASPPFFAVLSVQPPHNPYQAPPEYMERHTPDELHMRPNVPDVPRIQERARKELAGAYSQIENLDSNIGRIRRALKDAGLAEDTAILFFSDHGDMHGSHGQFLKTSPWEEALRIPFIVGGPSSLSNDTAQRAPHLINHVDIAPTTLGLCNLDVPESMRGHDYSDVCRGVIPTHTVPDSAFLQSVVPTMHGNSIDRPWRGVVTNDGWKYVALEHQPWLLFNLNEDPFELVNLAHNTVFKAERARLQDRLARWINETGDTFALPRIEQ